MQLTVHSSLENPCINENSIIKNNKKKNNSDSNQNNNRLTTFAVALLPLAKIKQKLFPSK